MNLNSQKIDLVYLWVNGNDPVWRNKRDETLKNYPNSNKTATCEARFFDNNELLYSLRSVEKNIPWINKIFIVTDNQIPDWLNTNNPKIQVIFHQDIMPNTALPSFNSVAIECCLPNIPGLEELFLYSNDDMFFNKMVAPSFFFTNEGYPIMRVKNKIGRRLLCKIKDFLLLKNNLGSLATIYTQDIVKKHLGKIKFPNSPLHGIDGYNKTDFQNFLVEFNEEINETIHHQFRMSNDLLRNAIYIYGHALSHGEICKKRGNNLSFLNTCQDIEEQILHKKPEMFCINDSAHATDEDKKRVQQVLEHLFPEKSSFEK